MICKKTHVMFISVLKNIKNNYLLYSRVINTKVYRWKWLKKIVFLNLGRLSYKTTSGKN